MNVLELSKQVEILESGALNVATWKSFSVMYDIKSPSVIVIDESSVSEKARILILRAAL